MKDSQLTEIFIDKINENLDRYGFVDLVLKFNYVMDTIKANRDQEWYLDAIGYKKFENACVVRLSDLIREGKMSEAMRLKGFMHVIYKTKF